MNRLRQFRQLLHGAFLPLWIALNTLVAGIAVFSGYGGYIDQEYMPFAGVVAMTFPAWYLACVILLLIDLVICRAAALAPLAALIAALKPFLVFSPVNFGHYTPNPADADRTFKILSYNTLSFVDDEKLSTPDFNRTMHQVLASGADAVVMLEFENQGKLTKFVPQAQIDSLHAIYPYFERGGLGTVLFSKRPILHITPPEHIHSRGSIEAFRTQVAGRPINIFGVHLESIGLDANDKELYRELTDKNVIDNKNVSYERVRKQLIDKLYGAFSHRAWQAKMLRSYIEQLGGDAIVCGDFNDIPGCRTIHILEQIGMKDAYSELATGPTITFNAPHFYFRIDHVLWRGNFRAVDIERGNVASSDHYPLLTTFVWDADAASSPQQEGTKD